MTNALDGWIDICRTGTWKGIDGKPVTVDEKHFDDLVATYATQDPAPIVVGHPELDSPAYGWVDKLRRAGDRLQMRVRDLNAEFRAAVEAGQYASRSIASADGKLRHVGFLGGRAPAVPGLTPTQFAAEPDQIIELAEGDLTTRQGTRFLARVVAGILRSLRDKTIDEEGIEAANNLFPSWDIDHAASIANDMEGDEPGPNAGPSFSEPEPELVVEDQFVRKPTPTASPALDIAAMAAKEQELAVREARLAERDAMLAESEEMSACNLALEPHVTAGRILPGERAGLAAVLASLPNDDASAVTFASAEDDKAEVKQKPREVLEALFAALPNRVPYAEVAGGKMPPNDVVRKGVTFASPTNITGLTVDESALNNHTRITKLAAAEGISYREALVRVAQLGDV